MGGDCENGGEPVLRKWNWGGGLTWIYEFINGKGRFIRFYPMWRTKLTI